MGLNEVYTVVRGNILMMNPLPSMAQAFSLLIQEEKQREFKPTGRMPMDSTALNAAIGSSSGKGGRSFRTNYHGNGYAGMNNNAGGSNNYSGSSSSRSAVICDFCKKQGRTKDKCFKLHGFPQNNNNHQGHRSNTYNNGQNSRQNSQQFKGKRVVANVHGITTDMMSAYEDEQSHGNGHQNARITKQQYGQIMNLLQYFRMEKAGEDQNGPANNTSSMNFADKELDLIEMAVYGDVIRPGNQCRCRTVAEVLGQYKSKDQAAPCKLPYADESL